MQGPYRVVVFWWASMWAMSQCNGALSKMVSSKFDVVTNFQSEDFWI